MIRKMISFALLGLVALAASAQSPSIVLSWTPSVSSTTTTPGTVNVYRETGACIVAPTTTAGFSLIATGIAPAGPFPDATVKYSTTYCWVVTAVIGGVESAPSAPFQYTFPATPIAPPTLLTGKPSN